MFARTAAVLLIASVSHADPCRFVNGAKVCVPRVVSKVAAPVVVEKVVDVVPSAAVTNVFYAGGQGLAAQAMVNRAVAQQLGELQINATVSGTVSGPGLGGYAATTQPYAQPYQPPAQQQPQPTFSLTAPTQQQQQPWTPQPQQQWQPQQQQQTCPSGGTCNAQPMQQQQRWQQPPPQQFPSQAPPGAFSFSQGRVESAVAKHCARCHGANAQGGFSIASATAGDVVQAIDAVASGRMPKGARLSPAEKTAVVRELARFNR